MHIRSLKRIKNEISIEEPIGTDREGNSITLYDILGNEHDEVLDEVNTKIELGKLRNCINTCLDRREQEVINMRFGLLDGKCLTQKQIASKLDISRSYVSRIEKKAISKLTESVVAYE